MKTIFDKYLVDEKGCVYNLDGKPRKTNKHKSYMIKGSKLYSINKLRAYSMAYLGAGLNDPIQHTGGIFSKDTINIYDINTFKPVYGNEKYMVNKDSIVIRADNLRVLKRQNNKGYISVNLSNDNKSILSTPIYKIMLDTFVFRDGLKKIMSITYKDKDFNNTSLDNIHYNIIPSKKIKGTNYYIDENENVYNSRMKKLTKTITGSYKIIIASETRIFTPSQILDAIEQDINLSEVFEKPKKTGCLEVLKLDMNDVYICTRVFKSSIYDKEVYSWSDGNVKTFKEHLERLKSAIKKPFSQLKMWEVKLLRKQLNK